MTDLDHQGDIMSLIRRVDENWYEARIGDTRGIVPVKYVEVSRHCFMGITCSLARNATPHRMKNLAFHSMLR